MDSFLAVFNTTQNATTSLSLNATVMRIVMPTESILFILLTLFPTIAVLLLFRSPVIKAYNCWYLLFNAISSCLNFCRFAIFWGMEGQTDVSWEYFRMVIHSLNNTILLWFVHYLLLLQFWRILHIFEANRLQYLITEEQHQSIGKTLDDELIQKLKKKLQLHHYFVSKTFMLLVFCLIGVYHVLIFILAMIMLGAVPTIYCYYFTFITAMFSSIFTGCVLFVIIILIFARKIKAPYFIWPVTLWNLCTLCIFIIMNVIILARPFITVDLYLLIFNLLLVPTSLFIAFLGSITLLVFPLVKHLFTYCKTQDYKEVEEDLTKVVESKFTSKMFQEFCVLEWSSENVIFYMEIKKLKQCKNFSEREKWDQVDRIYQQFFASNAPMTLNTTYDKVNKVKQAIENKDWTKIESSLRVIEEDVQILMADTYQRFLAYKPYKEHRKSVVLVSTTQKQLNWNDTA